VTIRLAAAAFIVAIGTPAFAQELPDGAGKDVALRLCSQCHEAQRAASVRLTREGWESELAKMVDLGMEATDEELKQVLDYFSDKFKGEASRPLNLNTATSVELESVVALLRKEAAAWIEYRKKNGPCKTLDDLKKVQGLPFKKIDERRDRLVCF
jgi:competence ComEA-like helix-hairpin-helix protein